MGDSFAERSKSIKEDNCKRLLLIPKIILQMICIWPEIDSTMTRVLSISLFINGTIQFLLNLLYMVNISDDIAEAADAFTTFNVNAQGLLRIYTLIIYRKEFAAVVKVVWNDFIPLNTLNESQRKSIDITTGRYLMFLVSFLVGSYLSTLAFMLAPTIITNQRKHPILMKLPFSLNIADTPYFEIVQVWLFFVAQCSICIPFTGFDTFYASMFYNCSVQFKILRINLTNMIDEKVSNTDPEHIRAQRQEQQIKLLIKYIKHHKLLVDFCSVLKRRFSYMLLIQLMQIGFGICLCAFASVVAPALMPKMGVFATTYILQLFLFCTFGNELTHQSRRVAYAAFSCGWHLADNPKMTKLLIPLIQNSQKGEEITAHGFATVNYECFITVLRSSFSCYTLLKKMVDKSKL